MNFSAALVGILLASLTASAQSPSTTLKNFHPVDPQGLIFRGSQPGSKINELRTLKIANVLIIKKQTHNEVDTEVAALTGLGIHSEVYPMEWDHADVKQLCRQVVEAVQSLQNYKRQGKKSYFHCTMGQDRTGAVAGLFRMADQGWTANRAFKEEMCGHGYSDGASGKPVTIVRQIEQSLTPVFLALSKNLSPSTGLDASACNRVVVPAKVPTCKALGASALE